MAPKAKGGPGQQASGDQPTAQPDEKPARKAASKPKSKKAPAPKKKSARKGKSPVTPAKSKANRPTTQEKAQIVDRRILVFELVKSGVSYRKISEHLKEKKIKGHSIATISDDFNEELANRRDHILGRNVEDYLVLALETSFDMLSSVVSRARKFGKKEDVDTVRNLWKDIDRYVQFSKAQKSELNANDALAKLLGIEPGDLPADRDE
jgi:hypothetical protein